MWFFNNMFLIISLKKAINIWEKFFTESWGSNPVEGRLFSKIKSLTPTSLELQIAVKKFSQILSLSLYQLSYRGKMKGGRRCSLGISKKAICSIILSHSRWISPLSQAFNLVFPPLFHWEMKLSWLFCPLPLVVNKNQSLKFHFPTQ